jgi:hypothetical protein
VACPALQNSKALLRKYFNNPVRIYLQSACGIDIRQRPLAQKCPTSKARLASEQRSFECVRGLSIVTRSKGEIKCLLDAMFREQELGEKDCFSDEEILDEAITFFAVCDPGE